MIETMRSKRGTETNPGWLRCGRGLTRYFSCRRYRTMESAANRLQKEAKGYLDSLRGTESLPLPLGLGFAAADASQTAMTASQMRIAETIDAFYGDAGANDGVSRSYKQAVEDLDAETIKALDGPFRYSYPRTHS